MDIAAEPSAAAEAEAAGELEAAPVAAICAEDFVIERPVVVSRKDQKKIGCRSARQLMANCFSTWGDGIEGLC